MATIRKSIRPTQVDGPALTSKAALAKGLTEEQAVFQFISWLTRFPDPDEVLRKAGLNRAALRALEFDDEVSQCLETRREALSATPWRLEPQEDRDALWLEQELAPWMDILLRAAFNAVSYGYSVQEVVYARRAGRISIGTLSEKPFEWFEPRSDGSLIYRPMQGGEITCDPRKYLLTVRNGSYRQPYGDSLLSRLYWTVYFKSSGRKFWARFMERHGEPLLIGQVADQAKFLNDVAALQLAAGLPIQPGDSVAAVSVSQPGEFERFENALSRSIQKLILGQTLTSDVGASGSYAAAKVHDAVRMDKRNADIRLVSPTVQSLIDHLAALNGFDPPTFTMADDTGLELDRAKRDALLVETGLLRLTKDYLLDRYDFRDGDFELIEPSAPQPPQLQGPDKPSEAPDGSTQDDDQSNGDDGLEVKMGAQMMAPRGVRQGQRFTADQQMVEDLVAATVWRASSPIPADALRRTIALAKDPSDLAERLASLYSGTNPDEFRTLLERALFSADVLGYVTAEKRIGAETVL